MFYLIFAVYLLIINLVAFVLMYVDKRKAIKKLWRIPESVLFGSACLLGGIGSIVGMYTFRHKTKHKLFVIGMPLITLVTYGIAVILILLIEGVLV